MPVYWSKATKFGNMATHIVDFGPGGASGAGSLAAKAMEGTGLVLNYFSEHSDIYDLKSFRKENSWAKDWMPRITKDRYLTFTKFR
jgi:fatty acid synthase subunit beta